MSNITLPNGTTTDALRADIDAYLKKGGRYDFVFTPDTVMALLDELDMAAQEIDMLRWFGNKDCTNMADDELDRLRGLGGENGQ